MMTTSRSDPLADLAENVGKALLEFAERLRATPDSTAPPEPDTATLSEPGSTPDTSKLGSIQTRILEVLQHAGSDGMTSTQIARAVEIPTSNAPRTLKQLEVRNLIVGSNERPAIWRLVVQQSDLEA